jgi:hypothetical protein
MPHILVDTLGLLLNVIVHPADVQDRDGALASQWSNGPVEFHPFDLPTGRVER